MFVEKNYLQKRLKRTAGLGTTNLINLMGLTIERTTVPYSKKK